MILIAGVAIVLAMGSYLFAFFAQDSVRLCRVAWANLAEIRENSPRFWRVVREPLAQVVSYGMQSASVVLVAMTPMFLIMRLRRPRPPWRALLIQPGMVAALSMVFGLFWLNGLVAILFPDWLAPIPRPWIAVGGSVAAAWLVLALFRRWKAEPGWVDRLGRLLGVIGIGTALLGLVMYLI